MFQFQLLPNQPHISLHYLNDYRCVLSQIAAIQQKVCETLCVSSASLLSRNWWKAESWLFEVIYIQHLPIWHESDRLDAAAKCIIYVMTFSKVFFTLLLPTEKKTLTGWSVGGNRLDSKVSLLPWLFLQIFYRTHFSSITARWTLKSAFFSRKQRQSEEEGKETSCTFVRFLTFS